MPYEKNKGDDEILNLCWFPHVLNDQSKNNIVNIRNNMLMAPGRNVWF